MWMQEVYEDFWNNKRSNKREIWKRLYGKIPSNFRPASIDYHLISADGERLTLLGIVALEKSNKIFEKVDTILSALKRIVIENPNQELFTMSAISEVTSLDKRTVGLLLAVAAEYGSFWNSATYGESDTIAFDTITIGRNDQVYYQYIRFSSIEELICMYLEEEEVQKRNEKKAAIGDVHSRVEDGGDYIQVKPIFKSKAPKVNPKLCFVLMPFVKEWSDRVYKDLIRKNVEALHLQCLRADKLTGQNIIEDIWTSINQAGCIIADVTGNNANVMYELGIAHTLGKPTILITQDIANIPFDFRHLRHIEYKEHTDGVRLFNKRIKAVIKELYGEYYMNLQI